MKATPQMIHLKDYAPTPYKIDHLELEFDLFPEYTDVIARSKLSLRKGAPTGATLQFDGRDLELQSVSIDGRKLSNKEYTSTPNTLTIPSLPKDCVLEIRNRIYPHLNKALEGLYVSEGMYCTQCEATGFRAITYFYDRPDVMLTFEVKISADKKSCPVLLSNGNFVAKGDLPNNRHWTSWQDPFPKPCYLFALVAGNLAVLEDQFQTASGINVRLGIYADAKDISKCDFAMKSLKEAMTWDEKAYGRECDLDDYKIVAVRDFNMGAMENKGLNVFNSARVLASQETTIDDNFQDIAAVIGHEYFHNWTGNRITCRDWFQLCLKEGLTVFRDQEFSQSLSSDAVERIDQVNFLRAAQFPEDDGPTSHPPRPDHFIEINNFYTLTVYEKGAEIVRMLKTLLGADLFRKGMDLYFERHDGQAVTQEDFIQAFSDVSGRDLLAQFMLWYTQAGAPRIRMKESFDAKAQTYTLTLSQSFLPNTKGPEKKPLLIPVRMGLLDTHGQALELYLNDAKKSYGTECVLEFSQPEQSFTFHKVQQRPVPSLFRMLSAPIRMENDLPDADLIFLMKHDSDAVNAWDAGQKLMIREILRLVDQVQKNQTLQLNADLVEAFGFVLAKNMKDKAFQSRGIALPSFEHVAQKMDVIDPDAISAARLFLRKELAKKFHALFSKHYNENTESGNFSTEPEAIARRKMKNTCLGYLASLEEPSTLELVLKQYHNANNMTDRACALSLLSNWNTPERKKVLEHFYTKWQQDPLVIDSWFSVQAQSQLASAFEDVQALLRHPAFDAQNPNRMRSLVGVFCKANAAHFHRKDGRGYEFAADQVINADRYNRQMAAALVRVFSQWRRYDSSRQTLMRTQLERIRKQDGLSSDVYELVSQILQD